MGELFEGYGATRNGCVDGTAWDEMLVGSGGARPAYRAVHATLRSMRSADLVARADALARSYLDQGVTFDFAGEERPFPLDVVPRVIAADEWVGIESGVAQRVRVLEAFLADVYGRREAVRAGVVPWRVVASASGFQRVAAGVEPANGVRVHVAGVDLVRDADGTIRVLEDNVRVPSGVSYVLANRQAMATVFPESFTTQRIRPVDDYPSMLLSALRAATPRHTADPTVVVLTPGIHNSAYFEHTLLARSMGVELVEGGDLHCAGGRIVMRTTDGERQVDVIYRRVDDEFLDPVHFRADSQLGCPGLLNAARAGAVTIANAIGNGVADDKLIYTYMPELCRFYLGEDLILPNVDTYRFAEPDQAAEAFARFGELVVKPVDGAGGKGLVICPTASAERLAELRCRIEADPRGWIAQPVVQLSTVPTLIGDRLRPRHVDLRPFAVNDGRSVWVLPGGLTRVALPEGELVVNSSQGGGSKDTWVLSSERPSVRPLPRPGRDGYRSALPRPDHGPHGADAPSAQRQQQQQGAPSSRPSSRAASSSDRRADREGPC